jgi:hypothetical protein
LRGPVLGGRREPLAEAAARERAVA